MWAAVALAFGLAMDATAVCAARAISSPHRSAVLRGPAEPDLAIGAGSRRELLFLPLLFGIFQSGMAAIGWVAGHFAGTYIAAYDDWVAFGLLALVGGHMIYEAATGAEDEERPGYPLLYLGLAIATSIDAAAAGITLPMVPVAPWISLVVIGTTTFVCSILGFLAGRALGRRVGTRLGILGGLVLVGIGVDILIRAA